MKHVDIPVRGMHCASCELVLENALRDLDSTLTVKASTKKGRVTIGSKGDIDLQRIHAAIRNAGYDIGEKNHIPWLSSDGEEYGLLLLAVMIALVSLRVLQSTNVSSLSFIHDSQGITSSLFLGLAAGVSTCMALVGGLVLGVSARHAEKHPEATALQKFRPHAYFNAGRVLGFAFFGGMLGLFGTLLMPSSGALGILLILVSLPMLIMGIQITGISPALSSKTFALPSGIARALGMHRRHEKEYGHDRSFMIGALTFFLPCGFTQIVQMTAVVSGGFFQGALVMSAFALGTAPGLLGIGGITSLTRGMFGRIFFKVAGIAVIVFAVMNLRAGVNLTGVTLPTRQESVLPKANVVNGVQEVRMEQDSYGYRPSSLSVKQGIPVRWIINSLDTRSCASSIRIPTLGITRMLSPGENIIEFTPQEPGSLRFTCSMGMYSGVFTVTP